jgi:hypothetical protein
MCSVRKIIRKTTTSKIIGTAIYSTSPSSDIIAASINVATVNTISIPISRYRNIQNYDSLSTESLTNVYAAFTIPSTSTGPSLLVIAQLICGFAVNIDEFTLGRK